MRLNHETNSYDLITDNEKDDFNTSNALPKFDTIDGKQTANVIRNSGFEEVDVNGHPQYYSAEMSAYQNQDSHYNYGDAHSGSYVAQVQAQGSYSYYAYSYTRHPLSQPDSLLSNGFTFDFWFKILNNPEGSANQMYIQLDFYDTLMSTYRNMYIYFSHYTILTNDTNVYFDYNSTHNTWHNINIDITSEFANFWNPVDNSYMTGIYFYAIAPANQPTISEFVFDDVSISSISTGNLITNYDFESGIDDWMYTRQTPGEVSQTVDHTEGTYAINLTSYNSFAEDSTGSFAGVQKYIGYPESYYPTTPGEVMVEFDWKYNDVVGGGENQRAELRIDYRYNSNTRYSIIMIGIDKDDFWNIYGTSNSTNYCYTMIDGFGSRDEWIHSSVDLYDVSQYFGSSDVCISRIRFQTYLGEYANSSTELLVDDFQLVAYPTADPGFEKVFWPGRTFTSWYTPFGENYVNRTTFSHNGIYAANLSSNIGVNTVSLYRSVLYYTLQDNVNFDVWWYLQHNLGTNYNSYISINLGGSYSISYYLALGPVNTISNSTYNARYLVDNANTNGSWFNLNKNIKSDADAALGAGNWNISGVYFYAYTPDDTNILTILFDDAHFIDAQKPVITNVVLTAIPEYDSTASIQVSAYDMISGIGSITLYYRLDGGSWTSTSGIRSFGITYDCTIPSAPYGTQVQFYAVATDRAGNSIVDNNFGSYYSYVVIDTTNPTISIINPLNGSIVYGTVSIEVDADDVGSNIDYVEIYTGLTLLETDDTAPYTYSWDTRTMSNGIHTITAVAYDEAGNFETATVLTVETNNDLANPYISSVQVMPNNVQYYDLATIAVGVTDESTIDDVVLYYRIGAGSWVSESMYTDGPLYLGDIPTQAWNTEVSFYIVATDIYGQSTSSGTEVTPHSYIVGDDILPQISVDAPSTNEILFGEVLFVLDGSDEGSDVVNASIYVGDELVFSNNTVVATYTWDTKSVENGNHTIVFVIEDGAGNLIEVEKTYQIENKFGQNALPIFQNYGVLFGIAAVGLIWGGVLLTKYIIKRRKVGGN